MNCIICGNQLSLQESNKQTHIENDLRYKQAWEETKEFIKKVGFEGLFDWMEKTEKKRGIEK